MASDRYGALHELLQDIRACTLCAPGLRVDPRPVVQVSAFSKILIAGQAPGRKVHESGVPFDDRSGDRLREWMGIDKDTFYDPMSSLLYLWASAIREKVSPAIFRPERSVRRRGVANFSVSWNLCG